MQAYSDQVTGSDGAAVDDAQGFGRSKAVMSYNTLLGSTIIGERACDAKAYFSTVAHESWA
jgi:hypothetical protein